MRKLAIRLSRLNTFVFIVGTYLFCTLLSFAANALKSWLGDIEFTNPQFDKSGTISMFVVAVILAPIFETLVFQKLPYCIGMRFRFFRKHIWVLASIAGLLFAVNHYYSLFYMIQTFWIGFLFLYIYVIRRKRDPFWTVALIHMIHNLIIWIVDLVEKGFRW